MKCESCGTEDEVHECWECDGQFCIDCDPGEMRSDEDGHTYCDKHGPNLSEEKEYDSDGQRMSPHSSMGLWDKKKSNDRAFSVGWSVIKFNPDDDTCEGCGGQKTPGHPFYAPDGPENGNCAGESPECQGPVCSNCAGWGADDSSDPNQCDCEYEPEEVVRGGQCPWCDADTPCEAEESNYTCPYNTPFGKYRGE